jgi:ADP-ribosylglycohydrolase
MPRTVFSPPTADQFIGCLWGLALGDALGAPVEALPPAEARRYVDEVLRPLAPILRGPAGYRFGQVTDDTQLARELLQSIAESGRFDPEVFAARLLEFVASGRLVGGGPATTAAAKQLALGSPWHDAGIPAPYAGNGAAMRVGPLGLCFAGDRLGLARAAVDQARVTHQDSRCAAGALAIAAAVEIAARGRPVRVAEFVAELVEWIEPVDQDVAAAVGRLEGWSALPPDRAADALAAGGLEPENNGSWCGISSFVTSSVCWSLYAFLIAPDDYWGGICTAIGIGGDTDTLAAMTGAIIGARTGSGGLPPRYLAELTDGGGWPAAELESLARRAHARLWASGGPWSG